MVSVFRMMQDIGCVMSYWMGSVFVSLSHKCSKICELRLRRINSIVVHIEVSTRILAEVSGEHERVVGHRYHLRGWRRRIGDRRPAISVALRREGTDYPDE